MFPLRCREDHRHLVLRDVPSHMFEAAGLRFAHQFLKGVQIVHDQLVAHLDLKPENIVIEASTQLYMVQSIKGRTESGRRYFLPISGQQGKCCGTSLTAKMHITVNPNLWQIDFGTLNLNNARS